MTEIFFHWPHPLYCPPPQSLILTPSSYFSFTDLPPCNGFLPSTILHWPFSFNGPCPCTRHSLHTLLLKWITEYMKLYPKEVTLAPCSVAFHVLHCERQGYFWNSLCKHNPLGTASSEAPSGGCSWVSPEPILGQLAGQGLGGSGTIGKGDEPYMKVWVQTHANTAVPGPHGHLHSSSSRMRPAVTLAYYLNIASLGDNPIPGLESPGEVNSNPIPSNVCKSRKPLISESYAGC